MGSRTWIKINCDRWLNGTIRGESAELRGIWVDLLVLAGSGKYGDSGEVKITDQVGFLDRQLADLLQISTRKWLNVKKRLQETDRICTTEKNIIVIVNWAKYQSEYERQKLQRTIKSADESAAKSADESAARDRDKRIENREYILSVFDHWNQQNIIVHKKLTDDIHSAIAAVLKNSSAEDIKAAINNYAEILQDEQYFFKYKWTLKDFLKRGMEKFANLEIAKSNYRRDKDGKAKGRGLPQNRTPTPDYDDL